MFKAIKMPRIRFLIAAFLTTVSLFGAATLATPANAASQALNADVSAHVNILNATQSTVDAARQIPSIDVPAAVSILKAPQRVLNAAGHLSSYYFNLSGWGQQNKLYIKAVGYCPGGFSVSYGGQGTGGSIVGAPVTQYGNTYYAYPTPTYANYWYEFYLSCWNSSSPGQYLGYRVMYSARGVIQAYRIS